MRGVHDRPRAVEKSEVPADAIRNEAVAVLEGGEPVGCAKAVDAIGYEDGHLGWDFAPRFEAWLREIDEGEGP